MGTLEDLPEGLALVVVAAVHTEALDEDRYGSSAGDRSFVVAMRPVRPCEDWAGMTVVSKPDYENQGGSADSFVSQGTTVFQAQLVH